jgi:hypothetical protein
MNELDGCAYTLVPGLGLVLGVRPLPVSGLRFAPSHPASTPRALAAPVEARRSRPVSGHSKSFSLEPAPRWSAGEPLLVPGSQR